MNNYADYDFYVNEYQGTLSIDLFDTLIVKASRDIDRNINCELTREKLNSLSEKEKYKLQYTACELVDYMNTYGSNSSNGKANSISIDGVSVTKNYRSQQEQNTTKKSIYDNLPQSLTRWL